MNTKQIHIKLGGDLHAALKDQAAAEDRSVQNVVVRALRAYLGAAQRPRAGRRGSRPETERGPHAAR